MPELSILVSAYNEEKNVPSLLKRLTSALDHSGIRGEVIFLNNHSTDRTGDIAQKYAERDKRITVIQRYHRTNKDLGSSLREGLDACLGEFIIIMDADLSHDPENIQELFAHRKEADIIVGSRFVTGGVGEMSRSRVLISKTYNFVAGFPIGWKVRDVTTGFKLYRSDIIKKLKLKNNGFGLHVEIILQALSKGYRAKEIPIHYHARMKGESKLDYKKQFKTYAKPIMDAMLSRLGL